MSAASGPSAHTRWQALLLLASANAVFLPFAIGASYAAMRAGLYLIYEGLPAPDPMRAAVIGGIASLAILPVLYLRLCRSPLRSLAMCGPFSFRTPAYDARMMLENLAARAGIPAPRLYVLETGRANALAAGSDPSEAVMVVTRGLLLLLEREELEAVLAHELYRVGRQDMGLNTAITATAVFLNLPFMLFPPSNLKRRAPSGARWFALFTLPLTPAILFATAPIIFLLRALSPEESELRADAAAATWTRRPASLITALAKIWGAGSQMPTSDRAVSHLCFASPASKLMAMRVQVSRPHADIKERIAAISRTCREATPEVINHALDTGLSFAERYLKSVDREIERRTTQASGRVSMNDEGALCVAQRVVGPASDVNEADNVRSTIVARVMPGDLVIAFQSSGPFHQVVTAAGTFGFLPRTTRFERTNRLAPDVFEQTPATFSEPLPSEPPPARTLTARHFGIAAAFGAVVFLSVVILQALVH